MAITLTLLPPQPTCTLCALHEACTSPGVPAVWWSGSQPPLPTTPALVCLGMNPGFEEDRANEPFMGRSGRVLKESYLLPFLSTFSIYLINTVRCYTPTNSPIPAKSMAACYTYLQSDLTTILSHHTTSRYLLCLGAIATTSLHKNLPKPNASPASLKHAMTHQSWPLPLPFPPTPVFTTYHPAAVLRTPTLIHPVKDHLNLLLHYHNSGSPPAPTPTIIPPRPPHLHPSSPKEGAIP